jgi:predicted MPP superfamily phosphohydrolase
MTLTMTVIEAVILVKAGPSLTWLLFVPVLLLIDFYVLSGVRGISKKWKFLQNKIFATCYWVFSGLLIAAMLFVTYSNAGFGIRMILLVGFFLVLLFKVCFLPFILADDLRRYVRYLKSRKKITAESQPLPASAIPRSEFLMKAGILAGTVPLAALRLNMKSELYDYHIRRQTIYLPNLPKAFDGVRIGQISDLHSGNLKDSRAVKNGVEMLMREKPDIIFFTGDLVDAFSYEMLHYLNIFSKVKAPLGVYSSLGNHDYGDYIDWANPEGKVKNFEEIIGHHKTLGWDLLRNEHRRIKVNGEEIGILGSENWGAISWLPKYGRMDPTVKNTDDLPVKLLLSHDPSHWRAQILPHYPQIDVMFSGHTHGMQFGLRTPNFQWSPVQYIYNEWAGLYQEGRQQLYVNVGFGFLAVKGRVGILPEITIFELKAAASPSLIRA